MTSLCAAVVCPLVKAKGNKKVGTLHNKKGIAIEATYTTRHMGNDVLLPHKGYIGLPRGSHADSRDNCTYCYVPVADDDVVFLATGGIFNNVNPIISLQGTTEIDQRVKSAVVEAGGHSQNLPFFTPEGREDRKLETLTELLR